MTVSASPANDAPFAANPGAMPTRESLEVSAGTYAYDADDEVTNWHAHDMHQIVYAFQGVIEVETADAHYFLPPQKAVWIPAGLKHQTILKQVRTMSVFFDQTMVPAAGTRARVLAVAPVLREMVVYAARWSITRPASDEVADGFFTSLSHLVFESLDHESPFSVPKSTDPLVAEIMTYTNNHLGDLPIQDLCRAVGVSERTLRRHFQDATGMTWREYLLHVRLLHAMALLTQRDRSVLEVALTVGFASPSAFTRAFTQYAGETPSSYRQHAEQ